MESVKAVPSFPYIGVTKDGRVKNMISGKWLSCCDNGNGYKQVFISIQNRKYMRYVHRLVAECFLPNPENLPEVNHKDGNKSNNNASNLEWCTRSQNILHALHAGLVKPSERQKRIASENGKKNIQYARKGWEKWSKTDEAKQCWIKNLEKADRWHKNDL